MVVRIQSWHNEERHNSQYTNCFPSSIELAVSPQPIQGCIKLNNSRSVWSRSSSGISSGIWGIVFGGGKRWW